MKKMFLTVVLVLMLSVPAFAYDTDWYTNDGGNTAVYMGGSGSAPAGWLRMNEGSNPTIIPGGAGGGGTGGAGGNATGGKAINKVRIDNNPTIAPVITVSPTIKPEFNNTNKIESGAVKNTNTVDVNIGGGLFSKTLSPEQNQSQGQMQGQDQKQGQLQGQEMNNGQEIAPVQTVVIKTDRPLVAIPTTSIPELNFGNGRMVDASKMLPKFKGVVLLKDGDIIHTVVDVIANVPFKKLYKTILTLSNDHRVQAPYMRFQIIRAEGQKSWNFGVPLSGGGSNAAGIAGSASSATSIGGTKAHDLFTIIVVNVIPE